MIWASEVRLLFNASITEYDIRHANVSVMRWLELKPPEVLDALDAMARNDRQRAVGLMSRDSKEFSQKLEAGFDDIIKEFIQANELDPEVDITDIRRDAVFVVNRPIPQVTFHDVITFVDKNHYHAMVKIGPKLAFFFPSEGDVRVSGLIRADKPEYAETVEKLKPGMLAFLSEFIEVLESTPDRKKVIRWLRDFVLLYKRRELDIEYYREFNRDAKFRVRQGEQNTLFDQGTDELADLVDISFNFINIIVPILQMMA